MPAMVRLHGSVKEMCNGLNESFVHTVKDQITVMEKTDTHMPTLLIKLL